MRYIQFHVKHTIHTALAEALEPLNLPGHTIDRLAQHHEMLVEWGSRINLTAILDPEKSAWLHFRDSLEGLSLLKGSSIVDLGSGGGFPGVPLAVASGLDTTLVEPRRKRASFLRVLATRLGCTNIRVREARSSDRPTLADTVVTRATFSTQAELLSCLRWANPNGQLLAWRNDRLPGASFDHGYVLLDQPRLIQGWFAGSVGESI